MPPIGESAPDLAPQPSVHEVAEFMGATVLEVMDSVKRLGLRHEPSLRALDEESLLFKHDVERIRRDLGYVSADEARVLELEGLLAAKERRREKFILGAVLTFAGLFLAAWIPEFIGWLAGTHRWRGRTFAEESALLLDVLVWIATSRLGRITLFLAALAFALFVGALLIYGLLPSVRRERKLARKQQASKSLAEAQQRERRQSAWESRRQGG